MSNFTIDFFLPDRYFVSSVLSTSTLNAGTCNYFITSKHITDKTTGRTMQQEIKKLAESHRQGVSDFLRALVSIKSYTGQEKKAIDCARKEMEKSGYDEVRVDGMGNLLGRIGSGKKVIAIDGHCDTVEAENLENWKHDPFTGKSEDGYIYGRGSCDQKGGVASTIYSAKILKEIGLPDDVTLWHVVSVQEELYEGINWQYILNEENITPDAVILTEPTNLDICVGQRGRMDIKVKTSGKSCHGANPDLGVNAIYKMMPIVKEIEAMNAQFPEKQPLGKATITITNIESSSPSMNAVADSAEVHIDRRLTQGETLESVVDEIQSLDAVRNSNAEVYVPEYQVKSYSGLVYPIKAYYAAWYTEESEPITQSAITAYENVFEQKPKVRVWNFSTNGVATKGIAGIPTIGFGPANELLAHTTEEKVSIEHLVKAMEFYAAFPHYWK